MSQEFENKVVLITGAAGGIGSATAKAFAKEGAKLFLVDLKKEGLEKVKKSLGLSDDRIQIKEADVTDESQVKSYVESAEKAFGKIDVFFNNAGILSTGFVRDTDVSDLEKILKVNVVGVFLGLKHVIRSMEKTGGGSIINTGSIDSFATDPGDGAYAASKHAVMAISKCAAAEEAEKGIRINLVCPGPVQTSMMERYVSEIYPDTPNALQAIYNKRIPMGRVARPEDIANAVLFFASERSSFVTATKLVVDGGYKHE